MSILANIAILSSGMALGFPAITIESLTNVTDPMALTQNQISWFGMHFIEIYLMYFISLIIYFQN